MKTEIKRVTLQNVGSIDNYLSDKKYANKIVTVRQNEPVPADEVKAFFRKTFTSVDEKFYEVFDLDVVPFAPVELQEYYYHDDLMFMFTGSGIKVKEFTAFTQAHGIYFEFTLSHLYSYLKENFWSLSDWGGNSGVLARGKDGSLYQVYFDMHPNDGWPPSDEYYNLHLRRTEVYTDFKHCYPILMATPSLFAKIIKTGTFRTYP